MVMGNLVEAVVSCLMMLMVMVIAHYLTGQLMLKDVDIFFKISSFCNIFIVIRTHYFIKIYVFLFILWYTYISRVLKIAILCNRFDCISEKLIINLLI